LICKTEGVRTGGGMRLAITSRMLITALVLSFLVAAPLAMALAHRRFASLVALWPAALFAALATLLPEVTAGKTLVETNAWVGSLGIDLAFRVDGLSLLFALLITGIGAFIFLYASRYLAGDPDRRRFFVYLTLFTGAMLGAVLADDLITLLVFWELTSFASFVLIGYQPEAPKARRSAQQGLLVTAGGGLAMLAGILLLGEIAGTYRIGEILAQGQALAAHPQAPAVIALLAVGAFAKSAQAPLHVWLANAMVAPTPVSAFLHSATMVKLGVYLLARFNPVFGEHDWWTPLLMSAGLATMLTGTVLALRESDLKRVLAYSTVVSLGTLVTLIGLPAKVAASAMVTFLVVHALYKACLFMVAGIVDHETGTRDATRLAGLARAMPVTAAVALLAGLSMAGLPPFVGFVGKELIYEAGLTAGSPALAVGIALLANACMVVVAGVVTVRCFFGPPAATPHAPHGKPRDPSPAMLAGPAVLAMLGLLFGLDPALAHGLLGPAASVVAGQPIEPAMSLWHGFTPMLALSVATLILGVLLLRHWHPLRSFLAGLAAIDRYGPDAAYDRIVTGLQRLAAWQSRLIQHGSLRGYLHATLAITTAAVLGTMIARAGFAWPAFDPAAGVQAAVLPTLVVLAALAVARTGNFTAGIVAAGMVGFGVALVFLFNGAPDLAFTQFSVEALSIVLLLAIIGRMPFHEIDSRSRRQRRRDAGLATLLGAVAAAVLLAVIAGPFDARLSDYYRESAVPLAHGRNLVNVIIVDFRALDTLGEITVLALAALAAAALLASSTTRPPAAAHKPGEDRR
jgi:multicomponent Na+:H+ antiporter subunit A